MIKLILIRHGATYSNTLKRYLGATDEPLLKNSILTLQQKTYPPIDILYRSPMKRCKQTAEIIYQDMTSIILEDLKECNFGDFELKNYQELSTNQDYQKWMITMELKTFPNGENLEDYKNRILKVIYKILKDNKNQNTSIGFIVHGGTIMNIMKHLSPQKTNIYDWSVKNGCGYIVTLDTQNKIEKMEEITE